MLSAPSPHHILNILVLAIFLSISLLVLARRWNVPSIPLLLITGIVFGQEGFNLIRVDALGPFYKTLISLSVAIILFEGGLTLDYSGYRHMNKPIKRLLTLGVISTWLLITFFIYVVFSYSFRFSMLAGSLVIVTGPTVILPILRRINLQKNLQNILHWEGVLVDPIGVFIAVFCFEFFISDLASTALLQFSLQFISGIGVGLLSGFICVTLLRRRLIPQDLVNIFVLCVAIITYGICDNIVPESGLLAVVLAGSIIGFKKPIPMEGIKRFKLELTQIFVALIFILLSSSLKISNLTLFGAQGLYLLIFVIFVVRPFAVMVSTFRTGLHLREILFLSWLAPRGVVAASMATLFSISLREEGIQNAWFIETFTFAVILTTVLMQGFTAGITAKGLRVQREDLNGILIIGIHPFSEYIADFLTQYAKKEVTFIDKNRAKVRQAKAKGYHALAEDSMDITLLEDPRFSNISMLFALTDNEELNRLVASQWAQTLGPKNVYKWYASDNQDNTHDSYNDLWTSLPKPSVISHELLEHSASINVRLHTNAPEKQTNFKQDNSICLLATWKDELMMDPQKRDSFMQKSDKPLNVLMLTRTKTP